MPHDGLTSKDLDGTPSGSQACIAALLDAVQRSVRLRTVAFILFLAPQRYLSAVYRDHESISRLSQDQLMSMASELGWKYHQTEGVPPFANVSCVVTPQSWNHSWDDCLRLPPGKGPFLRSPVRARDVL
jgi:hypothetical protein